MAAYKKKKIVCNFVLTVPPFGQTDDCLGFFFLI